MILAEDVTFTVNDSNGPVEGASVEFNGTTAITDALGEVIFKAVRAGKDLAYNVTKDGYNAAAGNLTILEEAVSEEVLLELTTYTVTFNVTDGTNPLEGAVVTFNGSDLTTDATGVVIFTDVAPGTGLAYSVTLDSRYFDDDGTIDVDGDEVVDVSLALTAIEDVLINKVNIYPNPTRGSIHVEGMDAGATYELYSINQQKITEGILDGSQIDLNVKVGIYILRIKNKGETLNYRLIVQ